MVSGTLLCQCSPVCDTEFGGASGRTLVEAVVESVATVQDVEPTELDPLYEILEVDALNQLIGSRNDTGDEPLELTFSYHGWNVFVHEGGIVRICDPEPEVKSAPAFERMAGD